MLLRSTVLTVALRPISRIVAAAVMQEPADFISRTERFVREQITALDHDASHDWRYIRPAFASEQVNWQARPLMTPAKLTARSHIDRVRKLALALAREEGNAVLPGAIEL